MRAKISDSSSRTAAGPDDSGKDELRSLASMLRDVTLKVVWRQWRVLGASAALKTHPRPVQSLVDPEALVLFSLLFIERERRLADLTRDWVVLNSDLLSVQRIKNLAKSYPSALRRDLTPRLESLARIAVSDGKDFRWRSLLKSPKGHAPDRDDPDLRLEPRKSKFPSDSIVSKTRAVRASVNDPSALLLRLRLGFGVGVKTDALGYLLGKSEYGNTVRKIAEATAYSAVAVRAAADDLAAARLIQASNAKPATYRADLERWRTFFGFTPPVWLYWHQQFVFVAAFDAWATDVEGRVLSPYAFGAHGRELLRQHERAFGHSQLALMMRHPEVTDWAANVSDAVQTLAADMLKYA